MHARTVRAAVEALVERLRPIAACVSDRPFGTASVRTGSVSISFMPFGHPVRLRRSDGASHVGLEVRLDYSVERADEGFVPRLAGYSFGVLDPDGREILTFHWHPGGASPVRHPHLHLSSRIPPIPLGRSGAVLTLAEAHIPTGFVTLADVVRLLIEEFGVEPRRPDWQAILTAAMPDRPTPD